MGQKKGLKKKKDPGGLRYDFKCLHGETGMSGQINYE